MSGFMRCGEFPKADKSSSMAGGKFPISLKTKSRSGCRVFLCLFGRKRWDLPLTQWLRSSNALIYSACFWLTTMYQEQCWALTVMTMTKRNKGPDVMKRPS